MDRKTTAWIAGLLAVSVVCFCSSIFLVFSGLAAGLSFPFLSGWFEGEEPHEDPLPTPIATQDVTRATAVLPETYETPSPFTHLYIEAQAIQQQVSILRGLSPREPLQCDFITGPEFRGMLEDSEPVLRLVESDRATFQALGFLEPDEEPVLDEVIPAGILLSAYDALEPGRCTVLWDSADENWQVEYARSYTRALIRQQFSLAPGSACSLFLPEYDACLAQRALLEGDAFLTAAQWQRQFGETGVEPSMLADPMPDTFLGQMVSFPFLFGEGFALQAYLEGGWAGVDRLYSEPLAATQQILHPQRSWQPVPLEPIGDFSEIPGPEWSVVNEGSLGEWLIHLYLAAELEEEQSRPAAEGWEADSFQVFQHRESGETLLVWVTLWRSIPAAFTARTALRDYANARYEDINTISPDEIVSESSPSIHIERSGVQTLLIAGPDPAILEAVREQITFPLRSP